MHFDIDQSVKCDHDALHQDLQLCVLCVSACVCVCVSEGSLPDSLIASETGESGGESVVGYV